jgi:hypothetical protein
MTDPKVEACEALRLLTSELLAVEKLLISLVDTTWGTSEQGAFSIAEDGLGNDPSCWMAAGAPPNLAEVIEGIRKKLRPAVGVGPSAESPAPAYGEGATMRILSSHVFGPFWCGGRFFRRPYSVTGELISPRVEGDRAVAEPTPRPFLLTGEFVSSRDDPGRDLRIEADDDDDSIRILTRPRAPVDACLVGDPVFPTPPSEGPVAGGEHTTLFGAGTLASPVGSDEAATPSPTPADAPASDPGLATPDELDAIVKALDAAAAGLREKKILVTWERRFASDKVVSFTGIYCQICDPRAHVRFGRVLLTSCEERQDDLGALARAFAATAVALRSGKTVARIANRSSTPPALITVAPVFGNDDVVAVAIEEICLLSVP